MCIASAGSRTERGQQQLHDSDGTVGRGRTGLVRVVHDAVDRDRHDRGRHGAHPPGGVPGDAGGTWCTSRAAGRECQPAGADRLRHGAGRRAVAHVGTRRRTSRQVAPQAQQVGVKGPTGIRKMQNKCVLGDFIGFQISKMYYKLNCCKLIYCKLNCC